MNLLHADNSHLTQRLDCIKQPVKQMREMFEVIVILVISLTLVLPAQAHQSYWYSVSNEMTEDQTVKLIANAEASVSDVQGWANDLLRALKENKLIRNKENVCSMIAVIDQESDFVANPIVPNLGDIAAKKVIEKLHKNRFALGYLVIGYLESNPAIGRSYLDQIRHAKTEKDLDLVYRKMIDDWLFIGGSLLFLDAIENNNSITTIGSMQVSVRFAREYTQQKQHKRLYLDDIWSLRDKLYTRYYGLYFGSAQLLAYSSGYDQKIYRFADYNAGRYASRNAAFQETISKLLDKKLAFDGDLLSYDKDGTPNYNPSNTETAIRELSLKFNLGLKPTDIREDLLLEKTERFRGTRTYSVINSKYVSLKRELPDIARLPVITLKSAKLRSRKMTTELFAYSVNGRYRKCMALNLDYLAY